MHYQKEVNFKHPQELQEGEHFLHIVRKGDERKWQHEVAHFDANGILVFGSEIIDEPYYESRENPTLEQRFDDMEPLLYTVFKHNVPILTQHREEFIF